MKTTDFINTYAKEAVDTGEYDDEAPMIKNDLHTIVRVATHLNQALGQHENLPTWVIEKLAQTKGMLVSVMDYMISQHEMGIKDEVPGFDTAQADKMYENILAEGEVTEFVQALAPALAAAGGAVAKGASVAGQAAVKGAQIAAPIIAKGARAVAKGASVAGQAVVKGAQIAAPIIAKGARAVGNAAAKVPGAVEKGIITGAEVANAVVPGGIFDPDGNVKGSQTLKKLTGIKEEATAGSSGSSSVAVTMQTLGEKGGFSKSDVHKKITGYSNMVSRGGPVKVKQ